MRPRERRETGEEDLFRARLDQIIDMSHALAKLAGAVDWRFLEARFGEVYSDGPGMPPLPTRLMAGLGATPLSPTQHVFPVYKRATHYFRSAGRFDRSGS